MGSSLSTRKTSSSSINPQTHLQHQQQQQQYNPFSAHNSNIDDDDTTLTSSSQLNMQHQQHHEEEEQPLHHQIMSSILIDDPNYNCGVGENSSAAGDSGIDLLVTNTNHLSSFRPTTTATTISSGSSASDSGASCTSGRSNSIRDTYTTTNAGGVIGLGSLDERYSCSNFSNNNNNNNNSSSQIPGFRSSSSSSPCRNTTHTLPPLPIHHLSAGHTNSLILSGDQQQQQHFVRNRKDLVSMRSSKYSPKTIAPIPSSDELEKRFTKVLVSERLIFVYNFKV